MHSAVQVVQVEQRAAVVQVAPQVHLEQADACLNFVAYQHRQ